MGRPKKTGSVITTPGTRLGYPLLKSNETSYCLTQHCKSMKLTAVCNRLHANKPLLTKLLRIMKLTAILVLVACLQISAKTYSQVVTWSGRDATLEKLFSDIEKQTGYVFFFNYDELKNSKPVTLQVNKAKLIEFSLRNEIPVALF